MRRVLYVTPDMIRAGRLDTPEGRAAYLRQNSDAPHDWRHELHALSGGNALLVFDHLDPARAASSPPPPFRYGGRAHGAPPAIVDPKCADADCDDDAVPGIAHCARHAGRTTTG